MKRKSRFIVVLISIFLLILLVACGGDQGAEEPAEAEAPAEAPAEAEAPVEEEAPAEKTDIVIGKIPITMEHGYHQGHVKHLIEYADTEYGVTVNVIDGEFSPDTAMAAVETFIAQGVDGILLHSTDEKVIDQMVEEAQRAGIPISTFYIPTASKSVPHLQINEAKTSFEMGAAAATKWQEWYPDIPIKIGVIDYLTVPIVQEHRTGPFIEGVMSVAPDAEVVSKLEGGGNIQKAMETMQDMLQAHPEVNVVYGANADHALGALAALKNAGRGTAVDGKVDTEIVVGTDATEAELLEVFDPASALKITQGLQPAINAQAEADLMMAMINGETPSDEWLNVDTFDKFISYYDTPIDEATEFLAYQYFSEVDLAEALGVEAEAPAETEAPAEKSDIVIGKIPITMEHGYHQGHVKHLIEYADNEYGVTVNVIDGEFSSDTAFSAVETFIAQGVDGILLHSTDEKVIDQMVEEAHRAGIPISTFYIPTGSRSVPHLQINEAKTSFEMGAAAATKWQEWYPDIPIKIGVIDFLTIPIVQEHRTGPFIEGVLSVAPDAEVVSKLEGGGNIQKAMETMQDMLQAHPEVNVVYGANADHALGALAALKNAGRGTAVDGKVDTEIVVGTDATEAELLEVFDPSSALKITQGLQPAINAQAEADLMMQMINGDVAFDEWLNVDTFDKFISFYDTPIDEATEFLAYQYFSEVDLAEALGQ